jgi:membrane-bound serine protease (ClpP class)
MRRYFSIVLGGVIGFFLFIPMISLGSQILVARFEGIVGPVSSRYFVQSIEKAEKEDAVCLVVEMDTPGGLDTSMRDIVKAELNSDVPIVVFIYPSGSRDASAGVFITLAAHIAAMAPGTNIGAAHPVAMGGGEMDEEMKKKVTNDAVAYIKSIAEKRGRNVEWSEKAVRESVSATEKEALELGIIDFVAEDLDDLLEKINGKSVDLPSGKIILKTEDADIVNIPMTFWDRLLTLIATPNVAYILMILGFYGLFYEITNPGAIIPGVVGALCLLLAFFAFQTLPINITGLLLLILGVIFFILEVLTPTYGPLTIGGIISMLIGSSMLINTDTAPFLKISWVVIISAVASTAAFFLFALGMAFRTMRKKSVTGKQGLIGEITTAKTKIDQDSGTVFLQGEIWNATSNEKIQKGGKVKVVDVDGLTLKVEKA